MGPMASSTARARPEPRLAGAAGPAGVILRRLLGGNAAIRLAALIVIAALAWAYVLGGAGTGMDPFAMTAWMAPLDGGAGGAANWSPGYALVMLGMWWPMMVAMMLPGAAPVVLLHARVIDQARQRGGAARELGDSVLFLAGYLLAWLGFSVLAVAAQWSLEATGLLDAAMMWSNSRWLAVGLLLAAGLYQMTPVKAACLAHCRSPAQYLARHWRRGATGSLRMGLEHGAYCLGCCWLLMALLFVGGAMNLIWIAGLSIIVLVEKLLPAGPWFGRLTGVLLLAAGATIAAL